MYLIVKDGKPFGFSNVPESDADFAVDSDKLYLDAYSIVDGQAVYDASYVLGQELRQRRNYLLASSDWTQLDDIPTDIKVEWQAYRQALRDVTDQAGFPDNITWPSEP
jgi:hypothetical protein